MYAITGITGRGGITGRALLNVGLPVRAVVRDATKGVAWKERGCQVALADMNDAPALTAAFTYVNGVFVLIPPIFDPTPGFPEARAIIAAVTSEAAQGRLSLDDRRAGDATEPAPPAWLLEQALGAAPSPACFLRAAWFIENAAWDVAPARDLGVVPSFLVCSRRRR